jgi:hypothetical protein
MSIYRPKGWLGTLEAGARPESDRQSYNFGRPLAPLIIFARIGPLTRGTLTFCKYSVMPQ